MLSLRILPSHYFIQGCHGNVLREGFPDHPVSRPRALPSLSPHTLCDGRGRVQPRSPSLRRYSCPAAGNAVSRQLSARSPFKDCLSHRESCPSSRPSLGSPHPSTDWGQVEGRPLSWVLLALEFPVELAEAVISSPLSLISPSAPSCFLALPCTDVIGEHSGCSPSQGVWPRGLHH